MDGLTGNIYFWDAIKIRIDFIARLWCLGLVTLYGLRYLKNKKNIEKGIDHVGKAAKVSIAFMLIGGMQKKSWKSYAVMAETTQAQILSILTVCTRTKMNMLFWQ